MADPKPIFVADASVLIKWAIDEKEDFDQAMHFRDDFLGNKIEICVPAHCFSEIGNTLGRVRNDAIEFFSDLLVSNVEQCNLTLESANLAFQLMQKYRGISFYDAGYHALALQQGALFITADEKYYKKTKKAGHIQLLKDYGKTR